LLDRALILYLPSIPEQKREPESKFWADFETARPILLGALLDVLSGALVRLPNVELSKKPRLADFAIWATAAEPQLGWSEGAFMDAYLQNQSAANDLALGASPIAAPIQALVRGGTFEGTATDLLKALKPYAGEDAGSQRSWPANGRGLSNALRRLAPNLRKLGIDVSFSRDTDRRRRRLITIRDFASAPSIASEESASSSVRRTQMDTNAARSDEAGHTAIHQNYSDTQDLNGALDDVDDADAKIHKSEPVPAVARVVGQSPLLGQQARKSRIEGEL
jgi:hypothetical protein